MLGQRGRTRRCGQLFFIFLYILLLYSITQFLFECTCHFDRQYEDEVHPYHSVRVQTGTPTWKQQVKGSVRVSIYKVTLIKKQYMDVDHQFILQKNR